MAAELTLPTELNVGEDLVITGTGFANTHAYTVDVQCPGTSPSIKFGGTTSGGGAVDTTDKLILTMNQEGLVHVSVNDGTTTVVGQVEVFRVG